MKESKNISIFVKYDCKYVRIMYKKLKQYTHIWPLSVQFKQNHSTQSIWDQITQWVRHVCVFTLQMRKICTKLRCNDLKAWIIMNI